MYQKPALPGDRQQEGTWIGPDGVEVALEVIDPKEGVIAVSLNEGTDDEPTRIRSMGYFRSMSGVQFLSVEKLPDESGVTGYVWGRVEKKGDELFIVPPSHRLFRRLVEDGTLQGEVTLGGDSAARCPNYRHRPPPHEVALLLFRRRERFVVQETRRVAG